MLRYGHRIRCFFDLNFAVCFLVTCNGTRSFVRNIENIFIRQLGNSISTTVMVGVSESLLAGPGRGKL